jgi:hypothetical protein
MRGCLKRRQNDQSAIWRYSFAAAQTWEARDGGAVSQILHAMNHLTWTNFVKYLPPERKTFSDNVVAMQLRDIAFCGVASGPAALYSITLADGRLTVA